MGELIKWILSVAGASSGLIAYKVLGPRNSLECHQLQQSWGTPYESPHRISGDACLNIFGGTLSPELQGALSGLIGIVLFLAPFAFDKILESVPKRSW